MASRHQRRGSSFIPPVDVPKSFARHASHERETELKDDEMSWRCKSSGEVRSLRLEGSFDV